MSRSSKKAKTKLEDQAPIRPRAVILPKLACAALLLIGAVTYANSLNGVFLLDDFGAIVGNPDIKDTEAIWHALIPPDRALDQSARWRGPVIALTLAVNYRVGGLNPRGYHVVNVAFHLLAAITLFGVVRRTLLYGRRKERQGPDATSQAFACALLWMVHPLLTDSVTYVIQRTSVIAGFFYLLTIYCCVRSFESGSRGKWSVAAVIACVAGMLSKEVMATAPVVVLLLDRAFFADSFRRILRERWRLYAGLAASWAALAWLMTASPHPGVIGFDLVVGPVDYAMSQCVMVVRYLKLAFLPIGLLFDYGPARSLPMADVLPAALVIMGLVGIMAASVRRRFRIAFCIAVFFIVLSPTSSFVPIVTEVGAERRMYLPLAAVVVLVVVGGHQLLGRLADRLVMSSLARRWTARGLVAIVATALGILTIARNRDYRSPQVMWRNALAKHPDNPRAHASLGLIFSMEGRNEEAVACFRRALALDGSYRQAQANLGKALDKLGRHEEAVQEYRRALALSPDDLRVRHSLGVALTALGRRHEAIETFREVLRRNPKHLDAQLNLAYTLRQSGRESEAVDAYRAAVSVAPDSIAARLKLGIGLANLGRRDEAIAELRAALRINPRHAPTLYALGNALLDENDFEKAGDAYRRALASKPRFADARCNLGIVLTRLGRLDDAESTFRDTVRMHPDHVIAHLNFARLLEQRGKLGQAELQYREVIRIQPGHRAARAALDSLRSRVAPN